MASEQNSKGRPIGEIGAVTFAFQIADTLKSGLNISLPFRLQAFIKWNATPNLSFSSFAFLQVLDPTMDGTLDTLLTMSCLALHQSPEKEQVQLEVIKIVLGALFQLSGVGVVQERIRPGLAELQQYSRVMPDAFRQEIATLCDAFADMSVASAASKAREASTALAAVTDGTSKPILFFVKASPVIGLQ